jgi:hypothetical protein
MSHYALVINNVVQQVIVAERDFINTLPDSSDWVQTSYNTRGGVHYDPNSNTPDGKEQLRYNYAGIGFNYDGIGFYSPQPFPSWALDKTTYLWEAPIPYPTDDNVYTWNESTNTWDLVSTTTPYISG